MKQKAKEEGQEDIRFTDLPPDLQVTLRRLSRAGVIYLGRNGCGFTRAFRKACMDKGTWKVIEENLGYEDLEVKLLLEAIALEGMKWASYSLIQKKYRSVNPEITI